MASSLAAQLSVIAVNSENSLNLKAQKAKHSKSLIFEPRIAASQSFDTIYALCHEGFQELCSLDRKFSEFQKDIFSEQSQEEDRSQMTAAQNAELDKRIEAFLALVGGRLRLSPAIKAVEWLVRKFRIHERNTSFVLLTFLPYHTLPVFTTLLSIINENIPQDFMFLHLYIRSLTRPPRHAIVQAAINNFQFASALNNYVLQVCRMRFQHSALTAFWAGIMTEAVCGMLDKARSGRKAVQRQNEQDVILRLLPTLNEGLSMKKELELRIGCYMLLSIVVSKASLDDKIITAMMEAVVIGWTSDTTIPGLVCLSILAQCREAKQLTKKLTKELMKVQNLAGLLVDLSKTRRLDRLVNGLCLALVERLRKNGDPSGLPVIENAVESQILADSQVCVLVKALILVTYQMDDTNGFQFQARSQLASLLVKLMRLSGHTGSLIQRALTETKVDMDELEFKLRTPIRPAKFHPSPQIDNVEDSDDVPAADITNFTELLAQLPEETVSKKSFLSHDSAHIYSDLCRIFLICTMSSATLDKFDEVSILSRESAIEDCTYLSFYMRTWCGPNPVIARASALQMATRRLSKFTSKAAMVDFQAIIPYAVTGLSDPSVKVRRASAELLLVMNQLHLPSANLKKKPKNYLRWATDIYGGESNTRGLYWMSPETAARLLVEIIAPALEECVLDRKHIETVLQNSLNSLRNGQPPPRNNTGRLSQSARSAIMSFFASHVINSPLFSVKLRLLLSANHVRSVAGLTRTKVLLPALQKWASLQDAEVTKICDDEQLYLPDLEEQFLMTVTANDEEGIQLLMSILKGDTGIRRITLVKALFIRLKEIWQSMKGELRLNVAEGLLEIAQSPSTGGNEASKLCVEGSADILHTSPLSTEILSTFLGQLPTAAKLADMSPATKRQRTSHGEVERTLVQDPTQLSDSIRKVTLVLQLVDGSEPGKHPELLKDLFNVLAELQRFKAHVSSELAYLQSMTLKSLLAILKTHRSNSNLKLDPSAVRADLLVDCVQKTASPQVQNAALLLIASLADTAPELVLHSVMPIFTFMSDSVLRQNDEYSAYVTSQTIREVIPPLIASLRKEKGSPVTGAAELLMSFVTAYEHVPAHRRKGLFTSLVQTIGPEDFLFAILAMLVDKYGNNESTISFATELSGAFGVEVQLRTAFNYVELVADILKPKPVYSTILFGANDNLNRQPDEVVLIQLSLLPKLLSQSRLVEDTGRLLDRDDMDAARVRELYSNLLEQLLALADTVKPQKSLYSACGDVLESILGLLSTSEFVKSVEGLLDRPNESLRRKILRSLEARIENESPSDAVSRVSMLGFLPQLTAIIRESRDNLYKYTAIACVDKISEKYGKKDLEAVAAAAETIASNHCLGQSDDRLRVMALLCLSSLVDILREGIISILLTAIPKVLEYLELSIGHATAGQKLHDACYSFISALAHHLPYMISGTFLIRLLEISNASAEVELDNEANDSRIQCLQLVAKQVDAKTMFCALEKDWQRVLTLGPKTLHEYINTFKTAVDKHPKGVIAKNSSILAKIFQHALDLRRQWYIVADTHFSQTARLEIESKFNLVAIQVIYKFNDATFRHIFTNLVEWATTSLPKKDTAGRILRLQSLYGFMLVFFESLKSIVTSYATYLLENAVEVLSTVNPKDDMSKELWSRVLRVLIKCFEHDQDDFWQSASHFNAIAPVLCTQFTHASSLPLLEELIPSIVELAAATDSSDHHKELNVAILKHLRSETAYVRLAAVRCQQQFTDRLGEEWLSMLPEMLPFISELQEDDDDVVEKETHRWIVKIEGVLGESLDSMLQ